MGKPFSQEIEQLERTYSWARQHPAPLLLNFVKGSLGHELVIVGSGGSLSAASFAELLHEGTGSIAKVVTPYSFLHSGVSYRRAHILLLSAGGSNRDILAALRYAVELEPPSVGVLSMKSRSKLSILSERLGVVCFQGVDIPSGNDGFLATNSLIATVTMLLRSYSEATAVPGPPPELQPASESEWNDDALSQVESWAVLFGSFGRAAAMDIESKLTEAALGSVQLADFRNFGHGRHNWIAKRSRTSGVVVLSGPSENLMAEKTTDLLPPIPIVRIRSDKPGALGGLELLMSSMKFVDRIGHVRGVDPGQPGVPLFGRKLYHLALPRRGVHYGRPKGMSLREAASITRKVGGADLRSLTPDALAFWRRSYKRFSHQLREAEFGAIVFDYDGTLCAPHRRFLGLENRVSRAIRGLLESGALVGIATGRGQSVAIDLRGTLPRALWNRVYIGYYNGSQVALLTDEEAPVRTEVGNLELEELRSAILSNSWLVSLVSPEVRPSQLSVCPNQTDRAVVRDALISLKHSLGLWDLRIFESGHSIDVITSEVSKQTVVQKCREETTSQGQHVLCIGDQGAWPGNDFELLSEPFALSVDQVSTNPLTGWNLSGPGIRGVDATVGYLEQSVASNGTIKYLGKPKKGGD